MAVRQGQVLARLDDSTLQAALRLYRAQLEAAKRQIPESEVRLEQARVQLQRQERLRKEGLNTPNDIDNAKAEVDSLVARIASAQETGEGRRKPDRDAADGDRRHGDPRAVQRRRALEGCAGRRNGLPCVGGRRLHAHRHLARSSTCARSRSKSTSTRATSIACAPDSRSRRCSMRIRTCRFPAQRDHDGADGRSAEGHRAGAHRLRAARSAHPARHGRQGDVPARGGQRGGGARSRRSR